MKKIKFILFAFTALLLVVLVGLKISAATTLDYNADNNGTNVVDSNTILVDNDLVTISANRKLTGTKNFSVATAENDSSLTFTYGLLPGGGTNSTGDKSLIVTSKVAGVKIGIYYTISDSKFSTNDQSKSGAISFYDETNTVLYSGDQSSSDNKVAYYDEYTINSTNNTILVGSTANRLVVFGIVVSQGVVSVEYNVTIMDGSETITTQTVVGGQNLLYRPTKYGYNFAGYYLDAEFNEPYDAENTPVTSNLTLYAKFNEWTVVPHKNELSAELVASIVNVYGQLSADLKVENTIYTILNNCQMQTSSGDPCIGTSGGISTAKNAIKFTVETSGTFTAVMTSAGGSARNAQLMAEDEAIVECSSGDAVWTTEQASAYERRTLTWKLEAGTYYLGGTNGMRIFEAKFVEDAELHQYENADQTSIRYVCAIRNIAAEELANITVTLKLTLEGANPANVNIPTVYTSVLGDNGFAAEANTYYMVYTITGLNVNEAYYGKTLTAQVVVTNGLETVTSIETVYIISNFTA